MAHPENMSVLIADAEAEEVKLLTIEIRNVFPYCRVEAIYSADEVLTWVSRHDWNVVFLDEILFQSGWLSLIPEIRKQLPKAAVVLQTERNDISIAMQAIRAGADHCYYKKAPTFLSELPPSLKALLERRQQQPAPMLLTDRTNDPYSPLSQEMTEIVYELDMDGRFVNVGPGVVKLLGYTPEELVGMHFSKVIPEDERQLAEHRLNERRTGDRATRNLEFRLLPKTGDKSEIVDVELTAMGRYDEHRHRLGTVGVIRDIRGRNRAIAQREEQLREQFREREEQIAKEYHAWEQQLEQELQKREEEAQREFSRREQDLAAEHARLKAEMEKELEHRQELQRRQEELQKEYVQREERLEQEQDRFKSVMQQELEGLKTEMQQELERRQELQRREEDLRRELQQREQRFTEEKTLLSAELERQIQERESQLRQEYQQHVEKISEERHRLEMDLGQRLKEQQEQLRQETQRQEERLSHERKALETELDRVLEQQQERPNSSGTVLIVEGQQTVLALTRTLLQQHGYTVIEAPSATEAMAICKAFKNPIHLMLTDVGKPGTISLELAQRFTAVRPEMKVLFLSGYVTDSKTHVDLLNQGISFLAKPFSPDALVRKIADTVDVTTSFKPAETKSVRLSALP
jgi:PAS domain S-box-containing protein